MFTLTGILSKLVTVYVHFLLHYMKLYYDKHRARKAINFARKKNRSMNFKITPTKGIRFCFICAIFMAFADIRKF